MKIISFNINGLRARLHQLQAIIDKHNPDIIGLQEIKVHDDQFPKQAILDMGYNVNYFGQKAHYGVAILSKNAPISIKKGFDNDTADSQKRVIMGKYDFKGKIITIINGYFPQGENISHETKFPAKEKFYLDLNNYIKNNFSDEDDFIVMGDVNVASLDIDIGIGAPNAKRWLRTGKCSFQPLERKWLESLMQLGLTDSYRYIYPNIDDQFSWFDYRSKGFLDNRGLRIDLILTSKWLTSKIDNVGIDYELRGIEKPSDHAPIWTEFSEI